MLLAANIQAEIDAQETNPSAVAELAGLNPTGVRDIIRGKSRNPGVATVDKIARALGVSVSYLLRDRTDDDLRLQITKILDALPPEERHRLLLTARAWVAGR